MQGGGDILAPPPRPNFKKGLFLCPFLCYYIRNNRSCSEENRQDLFSSLATTVIISFAVPSSNG